MGGVLAAHFFGSALPAALNAARTCREKEAALASAHPPGIIGYFFTMPSRHAYTATWVRSVR